MVVESGGGESCFFVGAVHSSLPFSSFGGLQIGSSFAAGAGAGAGSGAFFSSTLGAGAGSAVAAGPGDTMPAYRAAWSEACAQVEHAIAMFNGLSFYDVY